MTCPRCQRPLSAAEARIAERAGNCSLCGPGPARSERHQHRRVRDLLKGLALLVATREDYATETLGSLGSALDHAATGLRIAGAPEQFYRLIAAAGAEAIEERARRRREDAHRAAGLVECSLPDLLDRCFDQLEEAENAAQAPAKEEVAR